MRGRGAFTAALMGAAGAMAMPLSTLMRPDYAPSSFVGAMIGWTCIGHKWKLSRMREALKGLLTAVSLSLAGECRGIG